MMPSNNPKQKRSRRTTSDATDLVPEEGVSESMRPTSPSENYPVTSTSTDTTSYASPALDTKTSGYGGDLRIPSKEKLTRIFVPIEIVDRMVRTITDQKLLDAFLFTLLGTAFGLLTQLIPVQQFVDTWVIALVLVVVFIIILSVVRKSHTATLSEINKEIAEIRESTQRIES